MCSMFSALSLGALALVYLGGMSTVPAVKLFKAGLAKVKELWAKFRTPKA